MSIFKKDRFLLPIPNGSLSKHLSPHAIEECNSRVSEIMEKLANASPNISLMRTQTQGKYAIYVPNGHAKIEKYAAENSSAAIMHKFTPEFITSLAGVLLYLASHLLLPVTQTNCFWWQDINHRKKCLKFSPKPQKFHIAKITGYTVFCSQYCI